MKYSENRTSYGAKVEYLCRDNFTLVGEQSRTCNEDGIWTGSAPKCLYNWCPQPAEITGAKYDVNGLTTGSTVVYKCHQGYLLQGQPVSTLGVNFFSPKTRM